LAYENRTQNEMRRKHTANKGNAMEIRSNLPKFLGGTRNVNPSPLVDKKLLPTGPSASVAAALPLVALVRPQNIDVSLYDLTPEGRSRPAPVPHPEADMERADSDVSSGRGRSTKFWATTKGKSFIAAAVALFGGGMAGGIVGGLAARKRRSPLNLDGTVRTISGAPISGAHCQLTRLDKTAVTDANGQYRFQEGDSPIAANGESLACAHPDFHGGLGSINTRPIESYSDTVDLRMFSSDPAWKERCGPMPIFDYRQTNDDGAHYKRLMGDDPVGTQRTISGEVCQSLFERPSQAPSLDSINIDFERGLDQRNLLGYFTHTADGRPEVVLNTEYADRMSNSTSGKREMEALQTHETHHAYQPYYKTEGADGFGEATAKMVEHLHGLTEGWPRGTQCQGSYAGPYDEGGRYWYFIEMKHPGFLTEVYQDEEGDIAARVKRITGENLSDLVAECRTKGMP
jgi:hypothetical protein